MQRTTLIRAVSARTKMPPSTVGTVADALLEEIAIALDTGELVIYRDFGTFRAVDVRGAQRLNPKTGKTMDCPSFRTVRFKPSTKLRERLTRRLGG